MGAEWGAGWGNSRNLSLTLTTQVPFIHFYKQGLLVKIIKIKKKIRHPLVKIFPYMHVKSMDGSVR